MRMHCTYLELCDSHQMAGKATLTSGCWRLAGYLCCHLYKCVCVCAYVSLSIISMFIMRLRVREVRYEAAELRIDERE